MYSTKSAPLTALPPIDVLQRYPIEEAILYLRQSRARTYKQIKCGELRVIKDGKRAYIPGSEIARKSALPAIDTAKSAT
jgi:hypothetical protein